MTTLRDVIEALAELNDELTIYALGSPEWSGESPAVVALEPDDGSLPMEASGMEYFLEVDIAKEVIEVWSQWRNGKSPSRDEKINAVIHYAKFDAYITT